MSNEKTAISEIKNLMKKFGFYTETPIVEEKFLDAKLKDGTVIKVEGEELVEGAKVVVVTEEGEVPAPDGVHELEDGSKVETKEGIVAKIEAPAMEEEPKVEIEVEAEEEIRWGLVAAQARVDVWRSREASSRQEIKAVL